MLLFVLGELSKQTQNKYWTKFVLIDLCVSNITTTMIILVCRTFFSHFLFVFGALRTFPSSKLADVFFKWFGRRASVFETVEKGVSFASIVGLLFLTILTSDCFCLFVFQHRYAMRAGEKQPRCRPWRHPPHPKGKRQWLSKTPMTWLLVSFHAITVCIQSL